jgi:flagellar biosynthetic protein FliQ
VTAAYALDWFREMLWTAVLTAGPPILAVVVVGLLVAIVQAATQVNDQAVAFGPKAIAAVLSLVVAGSWMLAQLSEFMRAVFAAIGQQG